MVVIKICMIVAASRGQTYAYLSLIPTHVASWILKGVFIHDSKIMKVAYKENVVGQG